MSSAQRGGLTCPTASNIVVVNAVVAGQVMGIPTLEMAIPRVILEILGVILEILE